NICNILFFFLSLIKVLDASTLSFSTRVRWFAICFVAGFICSFLVSKRMEKHVQFALVSGFAIIQMTAAALPFAMESF
uniref:Uncharacterized protein n=1 Tax=Amazona collaria TaxID=241587 RepID=A0A8B9GP44_9PSIT